MYKELKVKTYHIEKNQLKFYTKWKGLLGKSFHAMIMIEITCSIGVEKFPQPDTTNAWQNQSNKM
jgi:hypothetical protein